jgi:hypothetical protein
VEGDGHGTQTTRAQLHRRIRCAGFAAVARVGDPLASTPVNDLRHGLEGEFTEGHELDRKTERQVPKAKAMIGRRLSQQQAKRLLAKFG